MEICIVCKKPAELVEMANARLCEECGKKRLKMFGTTPTPVCAVPARRDQ